eukprot:TRINITY_DN3415_c0_g1_i1.p1 TRINITY_DN3415_c0_g1~~TRINITY_DN3415_c0_g1_i1.p1  ORF type:complete len:216 (-),score=44.11 TRINITY_DN3415_c0_g1_i1:29-676(-)
MIQNSKIYDLKEEKSFDHHVQIAVDDLKNGKVIGVPTETIYGISCDASSSEGIKQIYEIKKRDYNKPIALSVCDVKDVYKYSDVIISDNLLNNLLPGPVTVVFKRKNTFNKDLNPNTDLIGIRVPDSNFIREISRKVGAIALTSANISNEQSSLCVSEFSSIHPYLSSIFDGGKLNVRSGSTVVDLSVKGKFKIIREGQDFEITLQKLLKELERI